jgi:hypothetical protein
MSRTKRLSNPRETLTMLAAALATMTLGSPLLAAPDRLPQFDPVKICRSGGALWGTPRQAAESCVRSEQEARAVLENSWNEILPADRTHCSLLVSTGGPPSYVELLSCVEMAREARAFRELRAKKTAEPAVVVAPRTVPKPKQSRLERHTGTACLSASS